MPAHFGKYNYAICRRLSRAALMKRMAQQAHNNNGTIGSQGSTSPTPSNGSSTTKTKTKKKKKDKSKKNGESVQLDDLDKNNNNNEATSNGDSSTDFDVDYEKANEELNNFIATLRMLNVDVIELCPDDELASESVFIGETAVTVNGLVLLCRPRNRLSEIDEVKQIIKSELNLPIIEIKDESALLNGGDVLWTGREIFVGLSSETNEAGARAVAAAFPEYSVTPVKVPNIATSNGNSNKKSSSQANKKQQTTNDNTTGLMLKSYVTMAGPDILCINRSQEASSMLRRMEREASYNYKLITLEDEQASNVLYLNGTLIHRNDLPNSVAILQEKIDYSRVPVKISELTRYNPYQGLDSLCLLVRKSHRIQTIV